MVCLNPPAEAAVAPLADVGLREFLVKDGGELLRLSLPSSMTKDAPINLEMDLGRQCQEALELVKLRLEQVGFSGKKPVWLASLKEVNEANRISNTDALLEKIPKKDMAEANRQLNLLKGSIDALRDAVRNEDIKSTIEVQDRAAKELYNLRLMAMKPGLPYSLPDDIAAGKPTLKGRATVELTIKRPSGAKPFELDDGTKSDQIPLTLIVDGYRAPVTAGNFVDLVNRKFYDNMPINSVDDLFVNCGKPDGGEGFVDPSSKEVRTIPLELFYKKDVTPVWHYSSDDDMRATEGFANPFQAFGALGMIHDPEDNDTASSQFFFLKWDQGLVAPGRNTLDGSSASFGYVVKNENALKQVKKGDVIAKATVVEGGSRLQK